MRVGYTAPPGSILRQGTLIVGRQTPADSSQDDPMAPAARDLEAALQKKLAEANGGTVPSAQSASTTRKPSETT